VRVERQHFYALQRPRRLLLLLLLLLGCRIGQRPKRGIRVDQQAAVAVQVNNLHGHTSIAHRFTCLGKHGLVRGVSDFNAFAKPRLP